MMKKLLIYTSFVLFFSSCTDEIIEKTDLENTFRVFWKYMDEHYIYFNEKNINWDSLYTVYAPRAKVLRTDDDLDSLLTEVLSHWEDRHISILRDKGKGVISGDSMSYRSNWRKEPFPAVLKYEFGNYEYKTNEFYTCSSWDYYYLKINTFGGKDFVPELHELLEKEREFTRYGIIIDFRHCPGGFLRIALNLVSLFYSGEKTLLYKQSKTGKGHNDFGHLEPITFAGKNVISPEMPLVVLTDSVCYSASNTCSYIFAELPNVTVVGTSTGGGGGTIQTVSLLNGLVLRYPHLKLFSSSGANIEFGLKPDIFCDFKRPEYETNKRDDQLATALDILESIRSGRESRRYRDMYQDEAEE